MGTARNKTHRFPFSAALACAVGMLVFGFSVAAWLSDSALAGQLWPGDINRSIVGILGGASEKNAAGEMQTALSAIAVQIRLLVIILLSVGVLQFRQLDRDIRFHVTSGILRRSATAFLASSSWWLLWGIGEAFSGSLQQFCTAVLPLWLSTTVGVLAWSFLGSAFTTTDDRTSTGSWRPLVIVASLAIAWIGVSFWMNQCLYDQLLIPHGDSAMYEEHLWNVWHGKGFRSYLDQGLFLGEHIQVIHLLLLPLHIFWPSHLLLELAESIALGSCVFPIFLIARRRIGGSAAALIAIAWLFYYPMHFLDIAIDQKTFRPIALALPFLFWMLEFAERRQFGRMLICLLVALSAKEDVALIICPLMAVLAVEARSAAKSDDAEKDSGPQSSAMWFWAASIGTAVYLVLTVLVIIPAFRSGDHVHYARYFGDLGGTPGELIKTAIAEPGRVIAKALGMRTLLYVCVFLAPLGFQSLRRPLLLTAGVLTFGMLSLLELGDEGLPPVPYHHFHAPLLVVVFWSAIAAVGRLSPANASTSGKSMSPFSASLLMLCCCVSTSATGSLMPCGFTFWSTESSFSYSNALASSDPNQQKRAKYATVVVAQIPATARVASTDYVHTRLTHCERSYDYSDYLRAVNNYQPGVPADTEFIVIDTAHRYSEIKTAADIRELREEPESWQLLPDETEGTFLILKRR